MQMGPVDVRVALVLHVGHTLIALLKLICAGSVELFFKTFFTVTLASGSLSKLSPFQNSLFPMDLKATR